MTVYVSTVNTCFSRLLFIKNPVVHDGTRLTKQTSSFRRKYLSLRHINYRERGVLHLTWITK